MHKFKELEIWKKYLDEIIKMTSKFRNGLV
jgi:hypothetical protein